MAIAYSKSLPLHIERRSTSSTIKWRLDSLAWRLSAAGGPQHLESGIFKSIYAYYGKFHFVFSFGLSTRDDDPNALKWFLRCLEAKNDYAPRCKLWLEAADGSRLTTLKSKVFYSCSI